MRSSEEGMFPLGSCWADDPEGLEVHKTALRLVMSRDEKEVRIRRRE